MPQTSSNAVAGTDAKASQFNKVVADLAEIYAGGPGVPIGAWVWWWSDGGSVPLNYKIMDGSAISDGASPLNGLTPPSMIDRFARGVANSDVRGTPVSGGTDSVVLTVGQMPSHTHTMPQVLGVGSPFDRLLPTTAGPGALFQTTGSAGNNEAHTNIPSYRGFVAIMRIK